jgi:acetyl esterase
MATVMSRYEVDVEDVEYVRHGGKPYLARVYKPRGPGPFPLMINLHGGAWTKKDRTSDVGMNEALAKSGVVVASLDFRMPPDAGYPASMQDVNYAIRWFKSRAKEYKTTPGNIGIVGTSSGGHQAMLTAMRPADARYAALAVDGKSDGDATVRAVVLCWPVIDPLGRYQYAAKLKAEGNPKLFDSVAKSHDQYWQNEAAMEEGNPTRALERGEKSPLPPVLYVQGTVDAAHPRPQLDRFVAAYRKAGGKLDLQFYEGVGEAFITNDAKSPQAIAAIDKIVEFVHREMR